MPRPLIDWAPWNDTTSLIMYTTVLVQVTQEYMYVYTLNSVESNYKCPPYILNASDKLKSQLVKS